jgi:peptide/nickel transport system substrate-binding protein
LEEKEMFSKRLLMVVGVILVASMVLSACAPKTPSATDAPVVTAAPTMVATEAPTMEPTVPPTTRRGGWLDEIAYSVVDAQSAITQIDAGAVDLFSYGVAADKLADIKAAGLCYTQSYGTYYSFIYNPAVFSDETKFNPFSNRKIREATNWLIDRDYVNQEFFAGGVLPKFFAMTTQLVDYTNVIEVARGLEAFYAYNFEKGKQVIVDEMVAMGATVGADGKFMFNDAPVSLIFLIRNDGDGTRLLMGNYFANQLEAVGFTTERQEKKSSELSPLWIRSNPTDGLWHVYTGGWGSSGLNRDEKNIFQEMHLPTSAQGIPLFLENDADPVFQQLGDDLANGKFVTLAERTEMMKQALPLAVQDSLQTWIVDLQSYAPFNCDLEVSADVGAGVETTFMGPYNLRFAGVEGGQLKNGSTDTFFADPWNPVDGANWVGNAWIQNATASRAFMPDPYTGLAWPLRASSADLVVQSGLPVATNLDWVNLTFEDTITVPADAWVDFDAVNQVFVTAGEKFPEGLTAKTKSTVYYPADLFTTVKWHDGNYMSAADFVMNMIMTFDRSKEDSAIFDEDTVGNFEAFLSHFKGVQIVSTDPLTIVTWDDNYFADAELNISGWWPNLGYGENSWQVLAMGNVAETNKELTWGVGKADLLEVEWMSFIGGPSLDIHVANLDALIADATIPYAPTMSAFLTAADATARYEGLKAWYAARGHFWVGTGPYFLDSVDLNGFTAVVKNNPEFPDLADRWSKFGIAPMGEAELDGPGQVKIGEETVFTVALTNRNTGEAYPTADVKEMKFLLYNDKGETVYVGAGVATADAGVFTLTIPADVAAKLVAGTGKIEAAAVLIPVAIPAFTTLDYVVVP